MTPLPAELVDRARQVDLLVTAQGLGARLKRISAAEHVGACPACGGTDRFSVNTRKQAWNCRGGGGGRDAISLVMHVEGLDFREAVEWLVGEAAEPKRHHPPEAAAVDPPKPAGDEEARKLRSAARIVADLVPIKDTPGERYLREVRKVDVDAIADVIERISTTHSARSANEGCEIRNPRGEAAKGRDSRGSHSQAEELEGTAKWRRGASRAVSACRV
jgi:hypothetical protein